MSQWKIEFWGSSESKSPVEKWLDKLYKNQLKDVLKELELLKELGNELKLPHSRALGDGLFELRERKYGYRIYYGFNGRHIIVLLAAGNKTSQEKDIALARRRLLAL